MIPLKLHIDFGCTVWLLQPQVIPFPQSLWETKFYKGNKLLILDPKSFISMILIRVSIGRQPQPRTTKKIWEKKPPLLATSSKGEGIWCYVTLNEGEVYDDALKVDLKKQARERSLWNNLWGVGSQRDVDTSHNPRIILDIIIHIQFESTIYVLQINRDLNIP